MKIKKLLLSLFISIFIASVFALPAAADMGPKPQVNITVINAPDELYYLDLLSKNHKTNSNIAEGEVLNQTMLELLYTYKNEGWYPAYVEGTAAPIWGNIVPKIEDGKSLHSYTYYGLPKEFCIITVSESGEVRKSELIKPIALKSSLTYDYTTGEVTQKSPISAYLIQFAYTCIPTLIIELFILFLFGFKIKENLKVFALTNLATQIFLSLTLGSALILSGYIAAGMFIFPIEAAIIVFESLVYRKYLIGKTQKRRVVYAVCANLVTWAIGFFTLTTQYEFIIRYL